MQPSIRERGKRVKYCNILIKLTLFISRDNLKHSLLSKGTSALYFPLPWRTSLFAARFLMLSCHLQRCCNVRTYSRIHVVQKQSAKDCTFLYCLREHEYFLARTPAWRITYVCCPRSQAHGGSYEPLTQTHVEILDGSRAGVNVGKSCGECPPFWDDVRLSKTVR